MDIFPCFNVSTEDCRLYYVMSTLPAQSAAALWLSPAPPAVDTTWRAGADAEALVCPAVPNPAGPDPSPPGPPGSAPPEPLPAPPRPCCTAVLSSSRSGHCQFLIQTGGDMSGQKRTLVPVLSLRWPGMLSPSQGHSPSLALVPLHLQSTSISSPLLVS